MFLLTKFLFPGFGRLKVNSKPNFISSRKCMKRISSLEDLEEILEKKIEAERERVKNFKQEHGKEKVADITVEQLYGGMRGMLGFVCDTSSLDPYKGVRFRGFSLQDIKEKMPKAENGKEPLPEGMFLLLLTGQVPCKKSVQFISQTWATNSELPAYAINIVKSLPKELSPMTQLSVALCALNKDSKFSRAYGEKVPRADFWKYILADSMELLAKLPTAAALIYNNKFRQSESNYQADPRLDWCANFAEMIGFSNEDFKELLRLYITLHCDHEGGNVSAHACHLVGSALSDPYLSYAAGLNGLAGPLHGRATEEVLIWLDKLVKEKGINASEQDIKDFCQDKEKQYCTLIPGYGHAVLLQTDPRFLCAMEFAQRVIPNDPMVKLVATVYKAVPEILKGVGRVRNPYANADAYSGVLFRHFGLKECSYYTVLFGISRAIGAMAQLVWSRALMTPIERPATITTDALIEKVKTNKEKNKGSATVEPFKSYKNLKYLLSQIFNQ